MNDLAALKLLAVLLALIMRRNDDRAMRAAVIYGVVTIGSVLAMPEPTTAWWYVLCAGIDAATAVAIRSCGDSQMTRIVRAGLLACVLINIAAAIEHPTDYMVIYELYPHLIGLAAIVELSGLLAGSTRIIRRCQPS